MIGQVVKEGTIERDEVKRIDVRQFPYDAYIINFDTKKQQLLR